MGRPRSSVVVLVFVPKYAPRWEALLLLFNTTRARAHSPDPKHRPQSADRGGVATITMDGGVAATRTRPVHTQAVILVGEEEAPS